MIFDVMIVMWQVLIDNLPWVLASKNLILTWIREEQRKWQ